MSPTGYLDKGASLGRDAPCLTLDGASLSYGDVVDLSHGIARALRRSGVGPGDKVGILSANDPTAFSCVFRDRPGRGGVVAPKQVEFWPDLPRSTVGKVLKTDVRTRLLSL